MRMTNGFSGVLGATAIVMTLAAAPASAQTFSNTAGITVVDGGETTSVINVSGVTGTITGLTLTLNGLSHTYPDDLVFGVYSASQNLGFVFFSGVGGSTDVTNLTLSFSDAGRLVLPESFVDTFPLVSGSYAPGNYGGYEFTNFPNATSFADFYTGNVNGGWTLFVDDVFAADGGSISGGWSLNFTTAATAVPEPATWGMMLMGFGMIGATARRRSRIATRVSFG